MSLDSEQGLVLASVRALKMASDLKDGVITVQSEMIEKLSRELAASSVALSAAKQRIEELQATALRLAQKVDEK